MGFAPEGGGPNKHTPDPPPSTNELVLGGPDPPPARTSWCWGVYERAGARRGAQGTPPHFTGDPAVFAVAEFDIINLQATSARRMFISNSGV